MAFGQILGSAQFGGGRDSRVGDLTQLTTQDKSSAVSAINEINGLAAIHDPNFIADKTSVTLAAMGSAVVTCSHLGNGAISAVSSDDNSVTAAVSGDTVTLTCVSNETANVTVTLKLAASMSYRADTLTIGVNTPSTNLEDYTWAEIQAIGAAGVGENYFDIGDTKTITLNGNVGAALTLSNYQCKVFIIHFNYRNDKGIYFQGFKTLDGVDVALCDSKYYSSNTDGSKYFNMNHWGNDSYGGWKGCDARYDILGSTDKATSGYGARATTSRVDYNATSAAKTSPVANTLMAALPADLRAALAAWTIYTDNTCDASNSSATVTASVDYLPLLSEFEVQGSRTYANEYEKNLQTQMSYYANGNSKIKYKHGSVGDTCIWWVRSAHCNFSYIFYNVNTSGFPSYFIANTAFGLAPAFRVA